LKTLLVNPAWDAAGVSIRQCKAINKYTNWEARHFRSTPTFNYATDITPENYKVDEFVSLIEQSDIIHFCSATPIYNTCTMNWGFDWNPLLKNKVVIFHDYCSFPGHWRDRAEAKDFWNRKEEMGWSAIFSSIPQAVHIYKDCVYIPDIVDEKSEEFELSNRSFDKVKLCYFPTGGGNNKNQAEFSQAMNQVSKNHKIETIITNGQSNSMVLNMKKRANLGFDALWREYHGMTTVENLALGIPTMCNISSEFVVEFNKFFQTDFFPFELVTNVTDIVSCISNYANNLDLLELRSKAVRQFMFEHWSAENIAKRIVKEYEKLLEEK
jgi:hypothetical protein